jgi:putative membrane protein
MRRDQALRLLLGWAINAGILLLLPHVVPAVHVRDLGAALLVAIVLGLLNTVLRPILIVLTLPITVVTLGFFIFVVNGLMFWLAAQILPGFEVAGFWWAVLAAAVFSLASWAVSSLLLAPR